MNVGRGISIHSRYAGLGTVVVVLVVCFLLCVPGYSAPMDKEGFFDDFSNPDSGWPVVADSEKSYGYVDGQYEMKIKRINNYYISYPPLEIPFTDYAVQADISYKVGWTGFGGIIFNHVLEPDESYYCFLIAPKTRAYTVIRYNNGRGEWILFWKANISYIKMNKEINKLKVEKHGTEYTFYANEHKLDAVKIKTPSANCHVGLIGWTLKEIPIVLRYDNFKVTPGQGS